MLRPYFLAFLILTTHSYGAAFFLLRKPANRKSNFYLAIINLLLGTLSLLTFAFSEIGLGHPVYYLAYLIPFIYFLTPFFYKYTVGLAKIATRNDWYHFLFPLLITLYILVRIPMIIAQAKGTGDFLFNLRSVPIDFYLLLQGGLVILAGYLISLFFVIRHYHIHIKDVVSSLKKSNLRWLQIQIGIADLCGISMFLVNIGEYFFSESRFHTLFVLVEYSCLALFIIFYLSLIYCTFFQAETQVNWSSDAKETKDISTPKYAKQRLKKEIEEEIALKLQDFMNEKKPYLEPDLTIHTLAEALEIPAARITMVINIHLKMNFFTFVNKYRVEYACRLLSCSSERKVNILEIALESGFNSKTSFNIRFKKITGTTPSRYRQQNMNKKS